MVNGVLFFAEREPANLRALREPTGNVRVHRQ
jgi:hypothetical protein